MLDNLSSNATRNLPPHKQKQCTIGGHEWGVLDAELAIEHKHAFTRVLAADCFWMPYQHANLVKSMLHFLSLSQLARVFIVAGFHTGRAKLAAFFEEAALYELTIEEIYEEDAGGRKRPWDPKRGGGTEDHTERKKWLVIARLMRNPRS